MNSFVISRHVEGITINPKEYVLDDEGNVMKFSSADDALALLNEDMGKDYTIQEWEEFGVHIEEEEDPVD